MSPAAALAVPLMARPVCPDGHGPMVRKQGRTGPFYSCPTYPACRRSALVLLDLPCPRCRAPLVVRVAKKSGKPFTGCLGPEGERPALLPSPDPAIAMPTTSHSSVLDRAEIRRELGQLEDHVAETGWAWDAGTSQRVDALLVQIEGYRP